jgi:hypothetical protein
MPDTLVLDGEDGHVLWADILGIIRVGDRERTASDIVTASSVEVCCLLLIIHFLGAEYDVQKHTSGFPACPVTSVVFDRLVQRTLTSTCSPFSIT